MNLEKTLLIIHVFGAVLGLISGFMAMIVRKGSGLHGAAGTVYYVSMLTMSSTAVVIAKFYRPVLGNVVVGLLTFYLVITAWRAAKYREGKVGRFDFFGMLYVFAVGVLAYSGGIDALGHPKFSKDGLPGVMYFMFGTFAFVCSITDFRMLRRGSLLGSYRIARHLWRMSGALLIATMSFYPGQLRFLPGLRQYGALMFIPHIFVLGSMIYWMWRVKRRKRAQQNQVLTPVQGMA